MTPWKAASLLIVTGIAGIAAAAAPATVTRRDPAQRAEFMLKNPCPATGKTRGACPGYEVDHILALCAGGRDSPDNMQWLTVELHRMKTRADVAACRRRTVPALYD